MSNEPQDKIYLKKHTESHYNQLAQNQWEKPYLKINQRKKTCIAKREKCKDDCRFLFRNNEEKRQRSHIFKVLKVKYSQPKFYTKQTHTEKVPEKGREEAERMFEET